MKYIFSAIFLLAVGILTAQTTTDALRYSQTETLGTARKLGIGGAIGALGADYSALSINPAGLAWYRRGELVFTPSLSFNQATSTLESNDPNVRKRTKVGFNNAGFVAVSRPGRRWKTSNFAIGYNRLADFHQRFEFAGTTAGSVTDRFLEQSYNPVNSEYDLLPDELDDFGAGLAYEVGAIYDKTTTGDDLYQYVSDFQAGELVDKTQLVETEGSLNELVFSFAGNYEERLMLGMTVGVPLLNYSERKVYKETDEENFNPTFDELTYRENLTTSGNGVNFKAGVIYRASQSLRLGIAAHSPSIIGMTDNFSTELEYAYTINGQERYQAESPEGAFNYRLRTPWKLIASGGFIIGKIGFLSAEAEYIDYSSARYNFNNSFNSEDLAFERELNDSIRTNFQSSVKLKLGGEFAYEKIRIRGGYTLNNSPYANDDAVNTSLSLGLGMRFEDFFWDVGYRIAMTGETYVPYLTSGDITAPLSRVSNDFRRQTFLMTFGFRF